MRRARTLTEDDRAAWTAFAHGAPPPRAKPTPESVSPPPATPARARPPRPVAVGEQPPGLDSGTWQRFRSGRLAPERTLDLHGKSAAAAHRALARFVDAAHADRIRCVEIITGKGSGERGGVIRRELPLWLAAPALRAVVLATAHPHAANPGATRLLLRRQRSHHPAQKTR